MLTNNIIKYRHVQLAGIWKYKPSTKGFSNIFKGGGTLYIWESISVERRSRIIQVKAFRDRASNERKLILVKSSEISFSWGRCLSRFG